MDEFRRLAAKIDQHMQQLSAEGVNDAPAIINRMMGYTPDLHKIWVGTSDDQLIALSNEFPGFYPIPFNGLENPAIQSILTALENDDLSIYSGQA